MARAAADTLRLAGLGRLTRRARGRRSQRTAAVLAGRLLRGGLRILGLGRAAATGTRGIAARRLFGLRGILGRRRGLQAGLPLLELRPRTASLEEVFLDLTDDNDTVAARAAALFQTSVETAEKEAVGDESDL